MESTMVIKVKYGDTLRRFNARVDENEKLDLDIDGLRAKIKSLFNFPHDSDLTLTYVDEDGDIVTLVDDDDLCDVMRQRLKFLRIDVHLNNDKFGKAYARSSGSSTPLRSPRIQHPLPDIDSKISEILKSVPEPLREAISKLSTDVASKAASTSPMIADLVGCFSKMGLSHVNVVPQSQYGAESSGKAEASENLMAHSVSNDPNVSKDDGLREVLPKTNLKEVFPKTSLKEVLPKTTAVDSTSKSSKDVDIGIAARGVGALLSSVDLNLPPFDSAPSGSTMSIAPPASNITAGDDRMDANENSVHQTTSVPMSTSSVDPMWPSDVNQPRTADLGGNLSTNCPFSGIPVANESAGSSRHPRRGHFKRGFNRDALMGMFHKGVRCDGCGVHPITGPRFKSKVKDDYDLCSICFAAMGSEADYIRIDRPVHYRHPLPFRGLYDHRQNFWLGTPGPDTQHVGALGAPHILRDRGIKPGRSRLDSCFILDVNVLDGTMIAPSTPFTKIWRMRNTGNLAWPRGSQLVWIGGDKFSDGVSVEIEVPADGVPVEGEIDIAVDFTAPELPGRYISYWRMSSPSGVKFGQRVWVLIQVDPSLKDSISDGFGGLNLNVPPESTRSNGAEIIDVNVRPIVDGGFQEPSNSFSVKEPAKPGVEQPKKDQEMNVPLNDSLLVGHGGASASAPPPPLPRSEATSTVLYPIIDLAESEADETSHPAVSFTGLPTSSEEIRSDKDAVEQTLLRELEEMGFKQVDLNKEILRMNEYDLEQSVDDLCGVSEWDPILEELQEMGFHDEETNKRLLKKNNGSIKGVVMDLLTGEKA
ncbi:hypothetical protein AB3S75_028882 [Citrus x aurantiifolia]